MCSNIYLATAAIKGAAKEVLAKKKKKQELLISKVKVETEVLESFKMMMDQLKTMNKASMNAPQTPINALQYHKHQ